MVKKITAEEINHLLSIKQQGEYLTGHKRHARQGEKGYRRKTLFQVLQEYLLLVGRYNFKASYFSKEPTRMKFASSTNMSDCPLSRGELINALKYGYENQLLSRSGPKSNVHWRLTRR